MPKKGNFHACERDQLQDITDLDAGLQVLLAVFLKSSLGHHSRREITVQYGTRHDFDTRCRVCAMYAASRSMLATERSFTKGRNRFSLLANQRRKLDAAPDSGPM